MTTTRSGPRSGDEHDGFRPGAVAAARRALLGEGAYVMPPETVGRRAGADSDGWTRFAEHWDELVPDAYAARNGTRRLRRYGHFLLDRDGGIEELTHEVFVQPKDTNPLYVGVDRHFDPLTVAFAADPVLAGLLRLLAGVAGALEDVPDAAGWHAKVHPFRVVADPDSQGQPTPEGRHQDGVTLVSSLLIGRSNATGGESAVYAPDGRRLLATTLSEPGTLLLGDDRRTWHSVTPIHPADPSRPARRDVLVATLTER